MGSYDCSCQISGVHIYYKQNAVLLLTEDSKYKDSNGFPTQVYGIPIHGKYTDYGEFEVTEHSLAHYQIMLNSMKPDYVLRSGFISLSQQDQAQKSNSIQLGKVFGINIYKLEDNFYFGLCEMKYDVKQMLTQYAKNTDSSLDDVLKTYPSFIQQWINEDNNQKVFDFRDITDIITLIKDIHSVAELKALVSRIVQCFFALNSSKVQSIQGKNIIPFDVFNTCIDTLVKQLCTTLEWKVVDADIYQALVENGLKHKLCAYSNNNHSKTVSLVQLYTKSKSWDVFMQVVSALRKHHLQLKQDISQAMDEDTLSFLKMKQESRLFKLTVDDKVGVGEKNITWKLFHSMYLDSERQYVIENQWFGSLPDELNVANFQDEWQKCIAFTKNFYYMLDFIPVRLMQADTSKLQQMISKATIARLKKQPPPTLGRQCFYSSDATLLTTIL